MGRHDSTKIWFCLASRMFYRKHSTHTYNAIISGARLTIRGAFT